MRMRVRVRRMTIMMMMMVMAAVVMMMVMVTMIRARPSGRHPALKARVVDVRPVRTSHGPWAVACRER